MNPELIEIMRKEAEEIFGCAYEAADPYQAVRRFVHRQGDRLILGEEKGKALLLDLKAYSRIVIVGGGKAAAPMARAVEDVLGSRIDCGLINVKYGFSEPLRIVEVMEAGHPVPDENGVSGTRKIRALLEAAGEADLIFSLISGGGSALLCMPEGEITLEDKQAITRDLLACGASIDEINAVRKHISSSKGGQFARAAFPATTLNLMLSDVVGDRTDVIASGPFTPDKSTFQLVSEILQKYDLKGLPFSIEKRLKAGLDGQLEETPKQGEPVFERVHNCIVGSNMMALEAAEEKAKKLGYHTLILSSMVEGEAREVARVHSGIAKEILKTGRPVSPPACVISGGETTVTLRGEGLGGRNQEFCLSAALDLVELPPRVVVLSGGTDGNDGPTDAAGAVVDSLTVKRGMEKGVHALAFLRQNDSYHYFEKTGELLMTGPTKTNVMDVRCILVR